MRENTLFQGRKTAKVKAQAGISALINHRQNDKGWEALVLRCLKCPESAELIKHDSYKPIWLDHLKALMPNTSDISSEGQREDPRHPFDILAGKFCAYRGWSSRTQSQGPDVEWLKRGAQFGDYLCCDRLCYLIQTSPEPSDDEVFKAIGYANTAANYHASIGYGLLAETYFRVGTYLKEQQPEESTVAVCFQLAAQNMTKAVELSPKSQLVSKQACYVHSRKNRFCGSADKRVNRSWERKGTTLEETQRTMMSVTLGHQELEQQPLSQPV